MNLLLIRHGEILPNIKKVYAGKSSEGLTEKGKKQAQKVAYELRNYSVHSLYSSPIQRAVQTAEIIGNKIGMDYIVEDNFREMELGPWEGLSEIKIANLYTEEWKTWLSRPAELKLEQRETLDKLLERVLKGIRNIYKVTVNKNVAVVTHVAIIRVLCLWHANKSLNLYKTIDIPNAKIFKLTLNSLKVE
jgi:alpha-ribazole phosphatase/probable phosphoglycerate mutase